jgi:hypothetical protein
VEEEGKLLYNSNERSVESFFGVSNSSGTRGRTGKNRTMNRTLELGKLDTLGNENHKTRTEGPPSRYYQVQVACRPEDKGTECDDIDVMIEELAWSRR